MTRKSSTIRRLSSRPVYANRWMSVREDQVSFPDGSTGIFGVLDKPDFVVIVPIHADGRLQLVEQYRYPVGRRLWELPQGAWQDGAPFDADALAAGELAEETGLRAGRLERIGVLHQGAGFSSQAGHLYLATDLTSGPTAREHEEQDMRSAAFDLKTVLAMIADARMTDAMSVSALGLLSLTGRLAALTGNAEHAAR